MQGATGSQGPQGISFQDIYFGAPLAISVGTPLFLGGSSATIAPSSGKIINTARNITTLAIGTDDVVPGGSTLIGQVYRSTDNGATYNPIGSAATITAGNRQASAVFGAVLLNSGDRIVIRYVATGVGFTTGASATVS